MKTISFNVNDVLTSVANASMAVNPQITIPILKNLLIEVVEVSDTRYMLIVGSDGETWVRKKAHVSFDSDLCSFCVDAKKLLSILNDLKNDTIVFNIDEENKKFKVEYNNKYIQRINRYYASTNGCYLYKVKDEGKGKQYFYCA